MPGGALPVSNDGNPRTKKICSGDPRQARTAQERSGVSLCEARPSRKQNRGETFASPRLARFLWEKPLFCSGGSVRGDFLPFLHDHRVSGAAPAAGAGAAVRLRAHPIDLPRCETADRHTGRGRQGKTFRFSGKGSRVEVSPRPIARKKVLATPIMLQL